MFLSHWLCVSLLPVLVQTSDGPSHSTSSISSLMDSLSCYNDYVSHIRCSWRHGTGSGPRDNLSLYHLGKDHSESLCVPYVPLDIRAEDDVTGWCEYNPKRISHGISYDFFFKKPRPPPLAKTVKLLDHVRVQPPAGLSPRAEGRDVLLTWISPLPPESPLSSKLLYQFSHRRAGEDWTLTEVSATQLVIDSLLPGCGYEARVRAKVSQGLWSDWSPSVKWKTEEAASDGASNLQCIYDGNGMVTCSWEMKRELHHFFTYKLKYHYSNTTSECVGAKLATSDPSDPVLRFSCSFTIPVSQTGDLHLKLTPNNNVKKFNSNASVQPPSPENVQITKKDEDWVLSWTPTPDSKISSSFQLRYWSDENQKVTLPELPSGLSLYSLSSKSLKVNTHYQAQVRALVNSKYTGIPSEWSKPVSWTTQPAPWSLINLLYIFIAVLVAALVIGLYVTLPAFHRRIVHWKVSLPSPIKSKVLEEIMKHSSSTVEPSQKDMDKAYICKVQVLESVRPLSCADDCWDSCANQHSPLCEETSAFSYNGPYLLSTFLQQGGVCESSSYPPGSHVSPVHPVPVCSDGYVSLPVAMAAQLPQSYADSEPPAYASLLSHTPQHMPGSPQVPSCQCHPAPHASAPTDSAGHL